MERGLRRLRRWHRSAGVGCWLIVRGRRRNVVPGRRVVLAYPASVVVLVTLGWLIRLADVRAMRFYVATDKHRCRLSA
jgi:hypothetical protein